MLQIFSPIILLMMIVPSFVIAEPITDNDRIELQAKEIVVKLAKCESHNNSLAWNKHDPETASMGILQFKLETWNQWNKYYDYPENEIMNPNQQKDLAQRIVADKRGSRVWVNCWKKIFK